MIKVIVADDHAVVRSGLSMLINNQEDMQVIATASDGQEACRLSAELTPDIVILDLNMPGMNGLLAASKLKQDCPSVQILVLTMHDDREYLLRVLKAGASGYILKRADDMDLMNAIRTVYRGEAYLHPTAAKILIQEYVKRVDVPSMEIAFHSLSSREKEIMLWIARGYSNKEIGAKLFLSVKTIEAHKVHVMEKLQLKTRSELVDYALKMGLLQLNRE